MSAREHKVIATVGGPMDEVSVDLCFYAEDLEPSELTNLLQIQPTSSHAKGDRRGSRSPPAKLGAWIFGKRQKTPADFDALVMSVLSAFSSDKVLWDELRSCYDVQLRIGLFQRLGIVDSD